MSNRKNYYFEQLVTESELDAGFNNAELAERAIMADQDLVGIAQGAVVTEAAVPDLTVVATGPAVMYDQQGQRIFWSPAQSVDVATDEDGNPTAVAVGGNEKTISIFAEFDRVLSDARVDGNGATVYFDSAESFAINVVQSPEAALGTSVPPALRPDQLLLCDIVLINGQSQILDADIDLTGRREDMFVLTGAPNSERAGTQGVALQAFQDQINAFINAGAASLAYTGGGAWKDGTTNPASTIEAQLDKIVADLAADDGAARIGAGAGPAWKDATAVAAASIAGRLDQIITDLVADDGAARIGAGTGPAWKDGTPIAAASIEARLDQITTDLVADAGAARIGIAAGSDGLLVAGNSVQQGLAALSGQARNTRRKKIAFLGAPQLDITGQGEGVTLWAPAHTADGNVFIAAAGDDSETLVVDLDFNVGDQITDIRVLGSSSLVLTMKIISVVAAGAATEELSDSGLLAATWDTTGVVGTGLNYTFVSGTELRAHFYTDGGGAGNVRIYAIECEYIPGTY